MFFFPSFQFIEILSFLLRLETQNLEVDYPRTSPVLLDTPFNQLLTEIYAGKLLSEQYRPRLKYGLRSKSLIVHKLHAFKQTHSSWILAKYMYFRYIEFLYKILLIFKLLRLKFQCLAIKNT